MNSNVNNKLRNKIIEILKYIGKFNINILIGAGTSILCMPSMKILSKAIQDDTKIITKMEEIQKEHKSEFDFNNNEIENTISLIESKSIIFPEIIQYRELYELIIQKIINEVNLNALQHYLSFIDKNSILQLSVLSQGEAIVSGIFTKIISIVKIEKPYNQPNIQNQDIF